MKHIFDHLFGGKSQMGGYSIKGRKPTQQDAWYISPNTKYGVLVLVADGVGGHAHGEYASKLCVEVFQHAFEEANIISDVPSFLKHQASSVSQAVWEKSQNDPNYKNCGTTLSAFLIQKQEFYFIHIGDSRIYLLDNSSNLHQISKDQTIIQQLLDQGEIQPEDIPHHPQKNVMYSAIGQEPSKIQVDIRGPEPIRKGEILLVCSDGIHDALPDQKIRQIIIAHKENEDLPKILVEAAYEAGGKDNITACYLRK